MSSAVIEHRLSKRELIQQFFCTQIGRKFSSPMLHAEFGSSFRTRVSDINLSADSPIWIHNEVAFDSERQAEVSVYWSELRVSSGAAPRREGKLGATETRYHPTNSGSAEMPTAPNPLKQASLFP